MGIPVAQPFKYLIASPQLPHSLCLATAQYYRKMLYNGR